MAWIDDLTTSMAMLKKIEPDICALLNGGHMLPVEGSTDEICEHLDKTCGCDYLHIYSNSGLTWGVASRIQYGPYRTKDGSPYNTFSVRKERESGAKTELEKRKYAIENNGIYPYLTMQAYFDKPDGILLSVGLARTKDIIDYVDKGYGYENHTGWDKTGQAFFKVCPWQDMIDKGYKVLVKDTLK